MIQTHVPIGQIKKDISELINRVAYGGERVILTSRGKPKAAIVSLEDVHTLEESADVERVAWWEKWLAENEKLSQQILSENQTDTKAFDALWDAVRAEKEERLDFLYRN